DRARLQSSVLHKSQGKRRDSTVISAPANVSVEEEEGTASVFILEAARLVPWYFMPLSSRRHRCRGEVHDYFLAGDQHDRARALDEPALLLPAGADLIGDGHVGLQCRRVEAALVALLRCDPVVEGDLCSLDRNAHE